MEAQGRLFNRVKDLDLYSMLGVEPDAKKKTIKKAYNKKSLGCNAEKNTGKFQGLSDALVVLSDEKTRAVYDNLLFVRKSGELKMEEMLLKLKNLKMEILKTEQEEGSKIIAAEDEARTAIDQHEIFERKMKKADEWKVIKKTEVKTKKVVENNSSKTRLNGFTVNEQKVKDAANSEKKKVEEKTLTKSKKKDGKKQKEMSKTRAKTIVTSPIKFLSGGCEKQRKAEDEEAEQARIEKQDGDSKDFGAWEKHTTGIGSKLLLDMGFQPGKGLGKNLQGRSTIVTACGKGRKGKRGLGASKPLKMSQCKQSSPGKPTTNPTKQNHNVQDNQDREDDKNNNNDNNKKYAMKDCDVKKVLPEAHIDMDLYDHDDGGEKKEIEPKKIFLMKHPQVMVGDKKTAFVNFVQIAKKLRREPKHLLEFLTTDLETTGAIQEGNQLIIEGQFHQKQIERVLRGYIKEYVACHRCRSPDTILKKETFLQCMVCNSTSLVKPIQAVRQGCQSEGGSEENRESQIKL